LLRLLLARHGETDWNKVGRYHGHTDVGLNEVGREQARKLARRLARERFDAIYSSDLKRAHWTAQEIASFHPVSPVVTDQLRELNLGEFEGRSFKDAEDGRPLEAAWEAGDIDFPIPGGETIYQLQSRVASFLSGLTEHYENGAIVLVAHGGLLRVVICHLIGIELKYWWRLRLSSASLSVVDIHPQDTRLVVLNDTCHLRDDEGTGA
jgi:alpha-ribazole phosphatase